LKFTKMHCVPTNLVISEEALTTLFKDLSHRSSTHSQFYISVTVPHKQHTASSMKSSQITIAA